MSVFEITIQRKVADYYPIVAKYSSRPDEPVEFLPVWSEGKLRLSQTDHDHLFSLIGQPREYGTYLGQLLFKDSIGNAFASARARSPECLRLLLFLETKESELQTLRWERLCARGDGNEWNFLRCDQRVPYSIYVPSLAARRFPPIGRYGLRALVLVASPENSEAYGLAAFDVEETVASVCASLGSVHCDVLADVDGALGLPTIGNLMTHLTKETYTFLHIVCHGRQREDVSLFLSDEHNQVTYVKGKELIEKLKDIEGLPHLTFLCTCESAKVDDDGAFGGFAGQLVRDLGMPAVVAMTEKITVRTAKRLVQAFYQRLIENGEVDLALDQATASVSSRDDVLVPALFSRLGGRPLFSDTLNRLLTPREIDNGLKRLKRLLEERAPVLIEEFDMQQKALRAEDNGVIEISSLNESARNKAQAALDELNKICGEVVGISFNAVALNKKVSQYDPRCPFPGLSPFTLQDKEFFCGREALVDSLKTKLEKSPFLVLVGPSGSGKSSLVLAGLVPALQKAQPNLKLIYIVLRSNPLQQLEDCLSEVKDLPFILVLEAFELLSTLSLAPEKQKEFIERLLEVVDSHQSQPKVVFTVRREFLTDSIHHNTLSNRQISVEKIEPMTAAELRLAMEQQAAKVGLKFEVGLSNTILDDIEEEPGSMPLLQHALNLLWQKRHGQWLINSEYQKFGGVKKAIASTADNFYEKLSEGEQARMKNIFIRLTRLDPDATTGKDSQDTRHRRVALSELVLAEGDPEKSLVQTQALVNNLAGDAVRLVRIEMSQEGSNHKIGSDVQEVVMAHKALIHDWSKLSQWLEENRSYYQRREKLSEDVRHWRKNKCRAEDLISQQKTLDAAKELGRLGFLNDAEAECVEKSQQAQLRKSRAYTIGVTGVAVLLAGVSVFACRQQKVAVEQKGIAEIGKQIAQLKEQSARASSWISEGKSAPGLMLSLGTLSQSVENDQYPPEVELNAQESVIDAVQRAREKNVLEGHENSVKAIAYDSKNDYIVTGGEDNSLKVWDAKTGKLLTARVKAHDDAIYTVVFSQDGKHLVSAGKDKTLNVWTIEPSDGDSLANRQTLDSIKLSLRNRIQGGHTQPIRAVAFSPEGDRFVSASDDQTLQLWNVKSGKPIGERMRGHTSIVWAVAISPDGTQIASGSVDRAIKVWDGKTGELTFTIPFAHEDSIFSIAFSPDSKRIVSGSGDRSIRVWDARTGAPIGFPLLGHDGKIYSVAFMPNNQTIVSTGSDRTIRFWHPETATETGKIVEAHSSLIWGLALMNNGKEMASVGSDKKIRLWDINNDLPLGQPQRTPHTKDILSIAISRDGDRIVSVGEDTKLMMWDVYTQKLLWKMQNVHDAPIQSVAFSPTEAKFVTASSDGTLKLWDATAQKNSIWRTKSNPSLTRNQRDIYTVAFAPDGKTVVSGGRDGKLRIWDVSTGDQKVEWIAANAKSPILSVAVSPDGKYIASAGADHIITLLDMHTGEVIQRFRGHTQDIWAIAFSPDGKLLVSGGKDDTLRLWQIEKGQQIGKELKGHTNDISTVAFSPTGKQIASGSFDKTIRLWDIQNIEQVKPYGPPLIGHLESIWSVQFMPDGKSIVSASADLTLRRWPSHWSQWSKMACERLENHQLMSDSQESANIDKDLAEISGAAKEACDRKFWQIKERVSMP